MTSNIGSHHIANMTDDYFAIKSAVLNEVKANFRPEFINRIDEIVVFHMLNEQQLCTITNIQLKYLKARLSKLDLTLTVTKNAIQALAKIGFDHFYGARPLKRAIQNEIENPIAKNILANCYAPHSTITVDYIKDNFVFQSSDNF